MKATAEHLGFSLLSRLLSQFFSHNLNKVAMLAFASIFFIYLTGLATHNQLNIFNQYYADCLFLGILLVSIGSRFKSTKTQVDPIFWLLLGGAFFVWFILTSIRILWWPDLSNSAKGIITNISYFFYYLLMIAAVEVKSYRTGGELLSVQSLLIWISTFAFVLGAFIFLVLTPSIETNSSQSQIHPNFVFYILMDGYLFFRWMHQAWLSKGHLWLAFFLFGLGSFNLLIADLAEGLHFTNRLNFSPGSWLDWIWYTPFLFLFVATRLDISSSQEQSQSPSFSRSHLLNSPLFFVISCFILERIISSSPDFFTDLNATQSNVYNLWLSTLLFFAVTQLFLLIHQARRRNNKLSEVITSSQVMQQRMHQQAQRLESQAASNQAILETTHNAIFTVNNKDEILSCNPAACRLLGSEKADIVGKNFIDIVQAEGELERYFRYQSYRQKVYSNAQGIELETIVNNSTNVKIPVHVTLSQETNNYDGLLVVSMVNISEQKKAEQEAHNLKDQFTANISHEFRTPLTIINGVLDNLLQQADDTKEIEQLKTAKRNGLRMTRMVEQLLELSQIANDPIPLTSIDAVPVIKFVCHSFEDIAENKKVEFEQQTLNQAWVKSNIQALEKILFNLLSNSFKYTEQGKVTVSLTKQQDQYCLTVSDTGIGISEVQQSLIFDRFHRVKSASTESIHGVGIGLSLVKELCDAMRWELVVESKLHQGSSFKIFAKATQAKIDAKQFTEPTETFSTNIRAEVSESQQAVKSDSPTKSKYSVLIVEDNHDMRQYINEVLSPFHQCLLAENGEEGVRLAFDYLPDIIISDVMMPGISGFELLKTLKSTEMTSHIPVILLTARGDSASKIRGLQCQADDYLSKPFDARELTLRITNQLNSRQQLQDKLASQWQLPPTSEQLPIEDKFIVRLEEIFDENYKNPDFSMAELANIIAMSDRQVQRKVKSVLGISPLEALKRFRLKKAKKLLESGDPIGVVALACGFSSQSYFGRCFKEIYELTPKAFQQSLASS